VPGRQDRYDEKLVQILDSACGIFAEKGYHNASVRDVAAATGVSPAGLYYYFPSKEELLFLILDLAMTSLLGRVSEALSEVPEPEARVRAIIRAHLAFFSSHPGEMRVLAREWEALTGDFRKKILARQRQYAGMVIRTLRLLHPDGSRTDLRAGAMALFGMLEWMYQGYVPERDCTIEELGDRFSRIFLQGFLPRTNGDPRKDGEGSSSRSRATISGQTRAASLLSGPGF